MIVEPLTSEYSVPEIDLVYQPSFKLSTLPEILTSLCAYKIFLKSWDRSKLEFVEQFKVLFMNKSNRVLGISTLSTGGTGSTIVDSKLVYAAAIKVNASRIIVAHNHPSGQLRPSEGDKLMTKILVEAGKLFEIKVIDHIIITADGYYSFDDKGAL